LHFFVRLMYLIYNMNFSILWVFLYPINEFFSLSSINYSINYTANKNTKNDESHFLLQFSFSHLTFSFNHRNTLNLNIPLLLSPLTLKIFIKDMGIWQVKKNNQIEEILWDFSWKVASYCIYIQPQSWFIEQKRMTFL
jgi:hypothetical protein